MLSGRRDPHRFVEAIRRSGLTIYDRIEVGHPELWIPTVDLETLLEESLRGISLAGLPIRTRSKVVKELVCRTLGYPLPSSFKKTRPRFPGQQLDAYTQKSNNLQIWNEEVSVGRRYALVRVSGDDSIARVRVLTGDVIAGFDTTRTLTQKYQARCLVGDEPTELVVAEDTDRLAPCVTEDARLEGASPLEAPDPESLLAIRSLFGKLASLVGRSFEDAGSDQERNRAAGMHEMVCRVLGYGEYLDDGRFPDVRHQLLEVKLQTSPTIDLGLVSPDSEELLDVRSPGLPELRHCDVRYGIFYGATDGRQVTLTHLILTTGRAFFSRLPRFEGRVLNKKLQIPLPSDLFDL